MTIRENSGRTETRVDAEIAATLKQLGVPYLFGIPGGGSSIDLIEACHTVGIPFVLVQHEATASLMAVVCGELSGSCGVCVSIMGPGAINLASGSNYAHLERHPLLCVTECYDPAQSPLISMQKIDHHRIFEPFGKESVTLTADNPRGQIENAIKTAQEERPGPVHLDLPHNIMSLFSSGEFHPGNNTTQREPQATGNLDAIVDTVNKAARPLLIVGPVVGRQNAGDNVIRVAEKLQMAVMVTSKARGIISEDHSLFAGVVSGVYQKGTFEHRIISQSDLVIAVGLDRMELLSPWSYPQPLVSLDQINVPDTDKVGNPLYEASGPLPQTLALLEVGLKSRTTWSVSVLRDFWENSLGVLGANDSCLNAASLLSRARKLAPTNSILTTEAGIYGRVNLYAWKVYGPQTYLDSSGANTMGFSLPAALSAALVRPDQKSIALVGDGGFLMRVAELETAARMKLSPVIIIFDDGTLGMIRVKQRAKGYARIGVDLAQADFVRIAESFGGQGWEVRTLEEFDWAFRKGLSSDTLTVIDARLDPEVYASHIQHIRGT